MSGAQCRVATDGGGDRDGGGDNDGGGDHDSQNGQDGQHLQSVANDDIGGGGGVFDGAPPGRW
jgi:hypothetical protein